jgi:protein SCO1/2
VHTHGRFLAAINSKTQGAALGGKSNTYSTLKEEYKIPDVVLTSEKGRKMSIREVLESDKPVMLNFIFTTCTTICPVLSASFSQVQDAMGSEVEDVTMVSISIDPEYDTVEKLSAYAQRFEAGEQWQFFTGQLEDIIAVERAFDIFRGSKMNHEPVTLIRASKDQSWLRIDGLANAGDIVSEYRNLLSNEN